MKTKKLDYYFFGVLVIACSALQTYNYFSGYDQQDAGEYGDRTPIRTFKQLMGKPLRFGNTILDDKNKVDLFWKEIDYQHHLEEPPPVLR
jgi:hypothetical protein